MYLNNFDSVSTFYNRLQDDVSREMYRARVEYSLNGNVEAWIDFLVRQGFSFQLNNFMNYMRLFKEERKCCIAVWGAGTIGRQNAVFLQRAGYEVSYFVDSNKEKQGRKLENIDIVSPEKLYHDKRQPIVVLSIKDLFAIKTCYTLLERNAYPLWRVFWDAEFDSHLLGSCGKQYFDLPALKREKEEVFVDGGAFDGNTTNDFFEWYGEGNAKAIILEPNPLQIGTIENNVKEWIAGGKAAVHNVALGNENGTARFHVNSVPAGSMLCSDGSIKVRKVCLDDILKGKKATFIKFDLEGAELEALEGAKETIKKWKPKMAISIYHKNEDIFEIPLYLMDIMPTYKFYLRHYLSVLPETVLYAV